MVSGMSTPEMTAGLPLFGEQAARVAAEERVQAAKSISIEDVSVSYALGHVARRSVLENISLEIEEGEFVVLLGETGCGKSTLLRMLLGQERPTAGQISVAGSRVERVDARSGYVPQRYSLFPDRTVLDNLMMGPLTSKFHILGRLRPSYWEARRAVGAEAFRQLAHMGLQASDAGKYPYQLSGGMQQRVAIAQALMMKNRVLLMDEAFSALDPSTRSSLQRLLRSVWSETRPTVVFVTHNTAEALFLGTRLIVLARESKDDACGSRVTLDMKLADGGMTLRTHGQKFLDLVEHIEAVSCGRRLTAPDHRGERRTDLDACGEESGRVGPVRVSPEDGVRQ
jgi:NitT/TauT family transport system ATP-binding protein